MAETKRPEVAAFIQGLIPIKGVDFSKPWSEIVGQINPQLKLLRYAPFPDGKPIKVALSDLDNPTPEDPETFDPFFIDGFYDNSGTPDDVRATAKLGLQAAYWRGLAKELYPWNRDVMPYEQWQKFVVLPVYTKGGEYYLLPSNVSTNGISTVQYGGDADMINYAQTRVMQSGGINIPFSQLEIPEPWLDEYIALRQKMDDVENASLREAVTSFRERNKREWDGLKKLYPKLDERVDEMQNYGVMFINLAEALVKDWAAAAFGDEPRPYELNSFLQEMQVQLGHYIFTRIDPVYGIKLFRNHEFYQAVEELGNLTHSIYESAVDSLLVKKYGN